MSKFSYISPATGDLEINVIKDATPRVVMNLDLGIPNFTVFSMKFPLVTEEPKNMAVVVQEALGVLLDEVATFMLSLKFDQAVITDVYARALSCFAGMTMESSTQADYDKVSQDPTMQTYKGTFVLPQSFVQETQKRVITGAAFVKRVPKQRVMEFVNAIPVNKNTINDAKRTIQMYKNRQLKTQPKPLYVLVYDMNGNPTGVLPVQDQWKNKLLRKIQSWHTASWVSHIGDGGIGFMLASGKVIIPTEEEYENEVGLEHRTFLENRGIDIVKEMAKGGIRFGMGGGEGGNEFDIESGGKRTETILRRVISLIDQAPIANDGYVLYDSKGNPTLEGTKKEVLAKLRKELHSKFGVLKNADDQAPPAGPVVVDQEYNGKGVDTSGTQKFTGVRPQVPPNNPGVAGTSTASASDWKWGSLPGMKNEGIGTPKYPAASKMVDEMMEGNIPPMDDKSYSCYIKAYQMFMESHEDLVKLTNEIAAKMSMDELETLAMGEDTEQKKIIKKYGKPGQAANKLLNELFDGDEVGANIRKFEDEAPKRKPRKTTALTVSEFREKFPKCYEALKQVVANEATMEVAFPGGFSTSSRVLIERAEEGDKQALQEIVQTARRFLKATGIIASVKIASTAEKNGEIGKEVYNAMKKRCFNLESETDGEAIYERHEGDIHITVHFDGQGIGDVELNLSGEEEGRWSNGNTHKEQGWEGIQSFTNTYGD